jgi:hypothetical protein
MSIGINDSGGGTLRITGWGGDEQAIVICPNKDTAVLWSKDVTAPRAGGWKTRPCPARGAK